MTSAILYERRMEWNIYTTLFAAIFFLHHGFELTLDLFQLKHLNRRRDGVPKHLKGKVDLATIRKAVNYNKDKLKLGLVSRLFDAVGIWAMVLIGFAWLDRYVASYDLGSLLGGLLFFGILGLGGTLLGLPLEVASTFHVEEKHGFNRQKASGFVADKFKGLVISTILGAAIVSPVLLFMENGGRFWWLYAFLGVTALQLLLAWIYPLVIMPLFNRFTDVPEDLLGDVAGLAEAVRFPLKSVFSMDGSKRSAHSNAFIIGLKGARKIALYDTLIDRISRSELLAVLAHELGHFKLKHMVKRIALNVGSLLLIFGALAYLKDLGAIYAGLGFVHVTDYAALVVFSLLISEAAAPVAWWFRIASRRNEHAADRFAVEAVQNGYDLKEALIALHKQNLSSPGSHKLYRYYYNSHPALRDRLKVIRAHAEALNLPLRVEPQADESDVLRETPGELTE